MINPHKMIPRTKRYGWDALLLFKTRHRDSTYPYALRTSQITKQITTIVPSSPYPNMLPPVSMGYASTLDRLTGSYLYGFGQCLTSILSSCFWPKGPRTFPCPTAKRIAFEDLLKRKRIAFFGLPAQRRRNVILTDPL
jgi:hypothetical protein